MRRGTPITVRWDNNLPAHHLLAKSIDPTVPDPSTKTLPKVRNVVHLHGGFSLPQFDGHPDAWYTPGMAQRDTHFVSNEYTYGNDQQATALWYHDHANATTRLNVYTGLVGMYLIRDEVEDRLNLPRGRFEVPLILSDKTFNRDGSLYYATQGVTTSHPAWVPEFFGDRALVNGKVHPYLEVEPRRYRFRLLNASNARFYHLTIETKTPRPFYQIGSDGGFMPTPVRLTDVLVAPAERLDLIVDFSHFTPGTVLTLRNDANAPYPGGGGGAPIPEIMRFRVTRPLSSPDSSATPESLAGSVCLVQIALAYEWLVSGINKVASPYFTTGLKLVLQQHVYNDERHTPYSAFLQRFVIPNAEGYAHLITWTEVLVGVVLLGSAVLWMAWPAVRLTAYAACAACVYLVAAIVMNLNYYLVDDEAVAWFNLLHAFDEGVQLDAMLLLFSLVLLGANVAALRALRRRAAD